MSDQRIMLLVTVPALCLLAACTEPSPCDEGEILRDWYCFAIADASADDPLRADADGVASEAAPGIDGGTAADSPAPSAFGKVCMATEECPAPTVYCAVQPGQPAGFCTAFGCEVDPSICPSGWGCMDLTPFGLPQHMCIPGS